MTSTELTNQAARWRVPDIFTPAEGVALSDAVLARSRQSVAAAAARFKGTVPPPPWPATPELLAARKRLQTMRDGLAVLAKHGVKLNPARMRQVQAATQEAGNALWRETIALMRRAESAPTAGDLARTFAGGVPRWLVGVAVLVWIDRNG